MSANAVSEHLPSAGSSNSARLAAIWRQAVVRRPALILVLLSALFGGIIIVLNPPLRGPDEPAHFLRIYGYAHGVLLPRTEEAGRKGIRIPARLDDGFAVFADAQWKFWTDHRHYNGVFDAYRHKMAEQPAIDTRPPVFHLFEGSEAYSPLSYLPQIAGAFVARLFGLDFAGMFYLMRIFGLAAMTAVAAYAVVMTPRLKWAFVLIAMLPASIYGRSVVGADGATVSYTLAVAALCLRAVGRDAERRRLQRALWMTLCVASKPPQIAFVLFEAMTVRLAALPRHYRTLLLVTLPGVLLMLLWIWLIGGEMAAWRVVDDQHPAIEFSAAWKLRFILEHPWHFPTMALTTLVAEAGLYLQQMIGVLGWLDMKLPGWSYPVLTLMLPLAGLEPLGLTPAQRGRIALVAGAVVVAYWLAVYLIFFITWTTTDSPQILGVQGRYFVPLLPAAAMIVAATRDWRVPADATAAIAAAAAVLSGIVTIETLWRLLW